MLRTQGGSAINTCHFQIKFQNLACSPFFLLRSELHPLNWRRNWRESAERRNKQREGFNPSGRMDINKLLTKQNPIKRRRQTRTADIAANRANRANRATRLAKKDGVIEAGRAVSNAYKQLESDDININIHMHHTYLSLLTNC